MRLSRSEPLTNRTASNATTAAKLVRPTAASTRIGLRGSRASRYSPSHQLKVNTTAESAAMNPVWHVSHLPALPAIAAVPRTVIAQRAQEVHATERRPVRLGEPHLRVRALPQQEAGEPLFARRADHQVGVGLAGGVEVFRNRLGGDGVDELFARRAVRELLGEQRAHRVDDLLTAAVRDG